MSRPDVPARRGLGPVTALGAAASAGALLLALLAWRYGAPAGAVLVGAVLALAGPAALALGLAGVAGRPVREVQADAAEAAAPPYALVLENLPDPVILAGRSRDDGPGPRVLFANAAARELFRLPRQGGVMAAVIRTPAVLEALEHALSGGAEAEAEFEEGGALDRTWRVVARPLAAAEGPPRVLVWMRDETDARRNERMRADFLANASHELRTPLASLSGFVETLRGHARDDPAARDRFLGIMAQQAERMSRLIDDLLSLSRIELNEHIAPSGEVDLAATAMDALDALGPLARERGVEIRTLLPGRDLALVIGDRDQIVQVAQNLIVNALKYAGGGGCVEVEVEPEASVEEAIAPRRPGAARLSLLAPAHASDARYGVLRVSDTGRGIARQHLPRLSERFYRVEGQTGGGTGLGLAIVKHIVNRHRGGLMVESLEGEGTTFTAYFPLARGPA
jgi:two-component system phosphate regulon sensor histidine kinase PhoR